jgi:hypothetical protein
MGAWDESPGHETSLSLVILVKFAERPGHETSLGVPSRWKITCIRQALVTKLNQH